METLRDFLSDKTYSDIYNISYQHLGLLSQNVQLTYSDTINELNHDNAKLIVVVKRDLKFTPENLYALSVSYYVEHYLKDEYHGILNWSKFDIKKEINDNIDYYSLNKMSRLSLIISQITSSFGLNPIVTPPIFINPQGNK